MSIAICEHVKWPILAGSEELPYTVRREDQGSSILISVYLNQQVLGAASVYPDFRSEGNSRVDCCYVANIQNCGVSHEGGNVHGVGTVLMKEVIVLSRELNFDGRVELFALGAAIPFYLKLGARPLDERFVREEQSRLPILLGLLDGRVSLPVNGCLMHFSREALSLWDRAIQEDGIVVLRDSRQRMLAESGFSPQECFARIIQRLGRGFLHRKDVVKIESAQAHAITK